MYRYKRLKVLGEGSFGKAVLVCDRNDRSKQYVAKEVRLGHLSQKDADDARREASFLKNLNHTNIIKYIDSFEDKGSKRLYILMEYADGGDLNEKIKSAKAQNRSFSEDEILGYFVQICLGVKHVHEKHIVHRDLKSQNVFLSKGGIVKIGDFGIAKSLGSTEQMAQTQIGTPYYLSPEICESKPYNRKTDIWSLGIILYELCALRLPFEAPNLPLLVDKIMRAQYAPLPSRFSRELQQLIGQMLQRNPKQRPSVKQVLVTPCIQSRVFTLARTLDTRSFGQALPATSATNTNQPNSEPNSPQRHSNAVMDIQDTGAERHKRLVQRVIEERQRRQELREQDKDRQERMRNAREKWRQQASKEKAIAREQYQKWLERERERERALEDAALQRAESSERAKMQARAAREAEIDRRMKMLQEAAASNVKMQQKLHSQQEAARARSRSEHAWAQHDFALDNKRIEISDRPPVASHGFAQRSDETYQGGRNRVGSDSCSTDNQWEPGAMHHYIDHEYDVRRRAEQRRQQRDAEAMEAARRAFFENRAAAERIKAKVNAQLSYERNSRDSFFYGGQSEDSCASPMNDHHSVYSAPAAHVPYDQDETNESRAERVRAAKLSRLAAEREEQERQIREAHLQAAKDRAALKAKLQMATLESHAPLGTEDSKETEECSKLEEEEKDDSNTSGIPSRSSATSSADVQQDYLEALERARREVWEERRRLKERLEAEKVENDALQNVSQSSETTGVGGHQTLSQDNTTGGDVDADVAARRAALKAVMDGDDDASTVNSASIASPEPRIAITQNERSVHSTAAADRNTESVTPSHNNNDTSGNEVQGQVVAKTRGGEAIMIDWGGKQAKKHSSTPKNNSKKENETSTKVGPLQLAAMRRKRATGITANKKAPRRSSRSRREKLSTVEEPDTVNKHVDEPCQNECSMPDTPASVSSEKPPLPPIRRTGSRSPQKPQSASHREHVQEKADMKQGNRFGTSEVSDYGRGSRYRRDRSRSPGRPFVREPSSSPQAKVGPASAPTDRIAAAISRAQQAAGNVRQLRANRRVSNTPTQVRNAARREILEDVNSPPAFGASKPAPIRRVMSTPVVELSQGHNEKGKSPLYVDTVPHKRYQSPPTTEIDSSQYYTDPLLPDTVGNFQSHSSLNGPDDEVVALEVEAASLRDELAEVLRLAREAAQHAKAAIQNESSQSGQTIDTNAREIANHSETQESKDDELDTSRHVENPASTLDNHELTYTFTFHSDSDESDDDYDDFRPLPDAEALMLARQTFNATLGQNNSSQGQAQETSDSATHIRSDPVSSSGQVTAHSSMTTDPSSSRIEQIELKTSELSTDELRSKLVDFLGAKEFFTVYHKIHHCRIKDGDPDAELDVLCEKMHPNVAKRLFPLFDELMQRADSCDESKDD